MFVLRARPKNGTLDTYFVATTGRWPDWEFLLRQGTRYPAPDYDLQNQVMGFYPPDVLKSYEFDWIKV